MIQLAMWLTGGLRQRGAEAAPWLLLLLALRLAKQLHELASGRALYEPFPIQEASVAIITRSKSFRNAGPPESGRT